MNTFLVLISIYNLSYAGNEFVKSVINNKIENLLEDFLINEKIKLDSRELLIFEALNRLFKEEMTASEYPAFLPFISIFVNIKNLYNLSEETDCFITYLKQYYGDIFAKNAKSESKSKKENTYFVTYYLDNKPISIWFTYESFNFEIIDASPIFKNLSLKEQYQTFYQILSDIQEGRKAEYNYSEDMPLIPSEEIDYLYSEVLKLEHVLKK